MSTKGPKYSLSLKKQVFFSLICAVIAVVLFVLVGETVFRLRRIAWTARIKSALGAEPPSDRGWAIFDPVLHYRNRPNWKDHNTLGMRDDPPNADGRFRVLLVGDSIGYEGDSPSDTYPGQLEHLLNRGRSLVACDVLNASVQGYTNYQELLYLKTYGFDLDPDLVILGFCVNDLHRFLDQFDVVDGDIVVSTRALTGEASGNAAPKLLAPSLFLTWAWNEGRHRMTRMGLRDGMIFDCRPDINTAWKEEHWPAIESQIGEMVDLCRARSIPFCVVAFPHAEQYRAAYLAEDRDYVLMPQRKLQSICGRLRIPLLDLYATLDDSFFIWDGIHLTPAGLSLAARTIYEFLEARELVPAGEE